jgi:hypothetical protein
VIHEHFLKPGRQLMFCLPNIGDRLSRIVRTEHNSGSSKIWVNPTPFCEHWFFVDREGVLHVPIEGQQHSGANDKTLETPEGTTLLVNVSGYWFEIGYLSDVLQGHEVMEAELRLQRLSGLQEGDHCRMIDLARSYEDPGCSSHYTVINGAVAAFSPEDDDFVLDIVERDNSQTFHISATAQIQEGHLQVEQVFRDKTLPVDLQAALVNARTKRP